MKRARYLSVKLTTVFTAGVLPLFIWSVAASAAEPFFMGLGDLSGNSFQSEAHGVSADGSVVVGRSISASGFEAFRWTQAGGMVGLGDLPGGPFNGLATDVSADGAVVVGWSYITPIATGNPRRPFNRRRAFRWTQGSGMVELGVLPGGNFHSVAYGVSADGSVVVGSSDGSAFRWTPDTGMESLVDGGVANGVSADGSVIVGYAGGEAFRWTMGGGIVGLGHLPGDDFSSSANGISADGGVVIGTSSTGSGGEAFRWTQTGGMVGLGILPGMQFSFAQDVSADGSVVVGSSNTHPGQGAFLEEAFLWDAAHGMRSLREVLINDFGLGAGLAGWTLAWATSISADGQFIVGAGTNPNGDTEAWIARLAPTLPGDYNNDGSVDAADYVLWRKNDGTSEGYNTWRANFGQPPGSGSVASANAAVPEPTTLMLLMLAAAGWCLRRGRAA